MRRLVSVLFGIALLAGAAGVAEAKIVHYMSQHPLPRKIGHGFCYIDVPHVHDFGPSDPRLYRDIDGQLYFVGDPAPFDYDGPRYPYYGAHPVVEADVQFGHPVYCYIKGPHYHWYQPPPDAQFQQRGGAYWYTGNYDPVYYQDRPRYAVVNDAYQPIAYTRPVVDVSVAPPSFHGEIVAVGPGVPVGHAYVGAPGFSAGIHIAAPPPPSVHVEVGVPAPVIIGAPPVIVGAAPVIVGAPPVMYHDNGRHRGWDHDEGRHRGWERHEEHGHGWRGPAPAPPPAMHAQPSGWRAPQPHNNGQGHQHGQQHGNGWRR